MKTVLIVSLVIGSFLLGSIFSSQVKEAPNFAQNESIVEDLVTPQPTPNLKPAVVPKTSTPSPIRKSPTPSPINDYLSSLTKCLKDKENDPLNEEIKKDRELLNKIDSSNFQCTSSPAECRAQISRERAVILARFTTNNDLLLLKYDCFGTNFKDNSSGNIEEAILVKDINSGDSVIIERNNGEQWLLEAKSWCRWCWREEGKTVYLKFGYSTSKLISGDGDEVSEFWTEKEL